MALNPLQAGCGCEDGPPPTLANIVATTGPACESVDIVERLIRSGVSVFRLNFSHGDAASHERRLGAVRQAARNLGITVAILGDLPGPKIRVGAVPPEVGATGSSGAGGIDVLPGQDVVLARDAEVAHVRKGAGGVEVVLPVTHAAVVDEVEAGQKVLINDGAIRMLAVERDSRAGELRCRVLVGGRITSGKGINLPQTVLSVSALTDRDWEWVRWAQKNDIDYLALSFVRRAEDVHLLRSRIDADAREGHAPWLHIVSKIECPAALEDLEHIVEISDAVMVARGDLGVELEISAVPVAQKRIVSICRDFGRPCIVATQMLESMIERLSPTRAEVSDVANAVLDGVDALMLSGETAVGRHPAIVVDTMARTIATAENWMRSCPPDEHPPKYLADSHRGIAALAHGAWDIAHGLGAVAIVCWSQNAGTARYLSQNRFAVPIIACSSDERACRRMALYRGVIPLLMQPPPTVSQWAQRVDEYLLVHHMARSGDPVVLLAGRPLGLAKKTNTLAIHRVACADA
jgi:pyruvate kinase